MRTSHVARRILVAITLLALSLYAFGQQINSAWPKYHNDLSNSGRSRAYGATNVVKWKSVLMFSGGFNVDNPVLGPDGTIFNSTFITNLNAFDPTNGKVKWSIPFELAGSGYSVGSDGTLYVCGSTFVAIDPATGATKFTVTPPSGVRFVGSPTFGPDGTLYIGGDDFNLYALDPVSYQVKWKVGVSGNESLSPAFGPDGTLYISTNAPKQIGGNSFIYAVNTTSHAVKWSYTADFYPVSAPTVGPDGSVYLGASTEVLAFDGQSGAVKWKFNVGANDAGSVTVAPNGTLYVNSSAQALFAIDPATGSQKWMLNGPTSDATIAGDGTLFAGALNLIEAIDGATGKVLWSYDTGTPDFVVSTPVIAADGTMYAETYLGKVYAFQSSFPPPAVASITLSPTTVVGGKTSTATVTLSNPLPYGQMQIALASSNPAVANVPTYVTANAGQTQVSFTVKTSGVDAQALSQISATLNNSKSASITVNPATLSAVSVSPNPAVGGNALDGAVELNGLVGPSGLKVTLTSDNSAASVPASINLQQNTSFGVFTVTTQGVSAQTTAIITAQAGVSVSTNVVLTPSKLVQVSANPAKIVGGNPTTGSVLLNGKAGPGGIQVALASGGGPAQVPAFVIVPAGQASATFTITTTPVSSETNVIISAAYGGTVSTTLTVAPLSLSGLSVFPSTIVGGAGSSGSVTLNGPAGASGALVSLTANSSVIKIPNSVKVLPGSNSASFDIATSGVANQTQVTITGTMGTSASALLTVIPAKLMSVALNATSVVGGNPVLGSVALDGFAPPGGAVVSLSTTSPSATVPASITVLPGAFSATFTVSTSVVVAETSVSISGNLGGIKSAPLTILPLAVASITFDPSHVVGGNSCSGKVSLNGPASSSGLTIGLSSTDPSVVVPASVTVPSGSSYVTFVTSTNPVKSSTTVTVWAVAGSSRVSGTLAVVPLALSSVTLNPSLIFGGLACTGTVSLNGAAPKAGAVVKLSSNNSVAAVPASITIPAGQSSANFAVKSTSVTVQKTATISATFSGVVLQATLTVVPPKLQSITLAPSNVPGGVRSVATVTLTGPAPAGGWKVLLKSNQTSATVPVSLVVAAGKTSGTFTVKTTAVTSSVVAQITATLPSGAVDAELTIQPITLTSISLKPSSVKAGGTSTATVTLTGPAPKGGLILTLASSSAQATTPASLTIPAGKSSATFVVKTLKPGAGTTATISAAVGATKVTATLGML